MPSVAYPEYPNSFDQCSSPYPTSTEQDMQPQYTYPDLDSNMMMFPAWDTPYLQSTSLLPHPHPQPHPQWSDRSISEYQTPRTLPTFSSYDSLPQVVISDTQAFFDSNVHAKVIRTGSRAESFASNTSLASNTSNFSSCMNSPRSDLSRSPSPNADELAKWGVLGEDGTWTCAFKGCTSKSVFRRGCDLRKHYRRHSKSLFCRIPGCQQGKGRQGGFSSEKDRTRHEAKHDPQILCEINDCNRLFSRVDNMVRRHVSIRKMSYLLTSFQRDHVRRIHRCKPIKKRTARKE